MHVDSFRQFCIEISILDVDLVNFPALAGGVRKNSTNRQKFCDSSKRFIEINAFTLCVAVCD